MSAPLSINQKRYLSQLARRAWHKAGPELDGIEEGAFRHQEVIKACGKIGLRCCDQNDYKLVEGHFLELLGFHGAAFNAQVRAATETRRLVAHKILDACQEFGMSVAYAEKICRAQNHGAGLDDVDEKTLWRIFYTVRNRGLARRKTAAQNAHA
ncbi:MAG: hypothetical protein KGL39_28350 [Patescibacteria group bacterium]|nr:hypothetical protein [Patescibacteria group bacterium]